MRAHTLLLLFAALALCAPAEKIERSRHLSGDDDHDGHEHDDHESEQHAWAWAGVFSLEADHTYTWSCARGTAGQYAAADLEFLMVPVSSADSAGLEAGEELAEGLWNDTLATHVEPGHAVPMGSFVHLELDQHSWLTTFQVQPAASGAYAVFTAHPPAEFENGFHYFKDDHGHDVEPVVSEQAENHDDDGHAGHDHDDHAGHDDHDDHAGHDDHDDHAGHDHGDHEGHDHDEHAAEADTEHDSKMGEVIAAGAVIALPSLVLIAVIAPLIQKVQGVMKDFSVLYSFASGAVLACAVFLLFPEGYLLAASGKSEADAAWTWGVSLIAGWLICVLIHWGCHIAFPHISDTLVSEIAGGVPAEEGKTDQGQGVNWAVAGPILLGDFWHNLVDGMVLGFSARHCGSSMTWTIAGVTIAHETPQEISDFFVLITKAGMKWYWAALLNFASGIASIIGAIIAYESTVSASFEGLTLTFGGGVYLYVAMTELGPSILSKATPAACAMRFSAFAVGAASIGLVLLGHEHCTGGGASNPHAGHDH